MAIIETRPAAYKKTEFLMQLAKTSGGNKDVRFEYPNSNRQKIEQLGKKVRDYSITAIIPHKNYFILRDLMIAVLESPGKGPLDHPMYGRIENVVVRTFVINETISELGRASIEIEFSIDDNAGAPFSSVDSASEIEALNINLQIALNNDIATKFKVTTNSIGNFRDAQKKLQDITKTIRSAVDSISIITDTVNIISANINSFNDSINLLISLPQDLANSITGLFSTVNGVFSTFESAVITYRSMFDFGDNDTQINLNTTGRIERENNRSAINQVMKISSLGYAYQNTAELISLSISQTAGVNGADPAPVLTTEDIDNVNIILENQYNSVNTDTRFSEEVKREITNLRTASNNLFDSARVDAKKVLTVHTHLRPMSEIAYQYYGNTELTETLIALNNIDNSAFVEGEIKILSR